MCYVLYLHKHFQKLLWLNLGKNTNFDNREICLNFAKVNRISSRTKYGIGLFPDSERGYLMEYENVNVINIDYAMILALLNVRWSTRWF